ncbi:uncharacterized protein PHALS_04677 [Plasmopara halstedii]|uniref:Uncharacterized protein n=1 Tax=Plasmopara halstedii TaxID=4781 RepID=A0A0N7L3Z3_PLAHL|nr:uncharacterized protein PHALS_04677 [Plasmopara halstedii]CEG37235.1 hypothetical protein PHALS_04677 [Plasmopara halstedii]|eukprot:XP_024573604.1 hypothetical protein PHALS_04677 [Plasmopara halstedii]
MASYGLVFSISDNYGEPPPALKLSELLTEVRYELWYLNRNMCIAIVIAFQSTKTLSAKKRQEKYRRQTRSQSNSSFRD